MSRTPQDWPPMSVGPPMLPSPLRPWRPRPRDPEEYDFETLDTVPEDCAVFFVMATYGEGEPTDNALQLMQNLQDNSFEFSKGGWDISGLKYVVFGLGNKTYEHYNVTSKYADNSLEKMGATQWKDGTLEAFASAIGVEGGNTAHFAVRELEPHPAEKVYLGELSARALTKTKGITHTKNPYPAPLTVARELFRDPKDKLPKLHPNSIHVTCVVLKYQSSPNDSVPERWVYGVGSNFLLNLKHAATGEETPLISDPGVAIPASQICPHTCWTFDVPITPKSPVVMLGPGTGVGPLPAFVQNA
ncbi:flavoprotein-like protein [Lentinula raphanica]|nr:flavoprotein-like protein [Lentinula raphanica]